VTSRCARLIDSEAGYDVGLGMPGGAIIPDDAFLELDPISALDHEETRLQPMDELAALAMPEPRRASVPTTRRSTRKA
jgi:type VI secretion system protein ImpI